MLRHASGSVDFLDSFSASPFFAKALGALAVTPGLVADRVDGIAECGHINTDLWLPSEAQLLFSSQTNLFPNGFKDVPVTAAYKGSSRLEYARLVCTKLKSGKVRL